MLDPHLFSSAGLDPALKVHLGRQHLQWLRQHAPALQRWGWGWSHVPAMEGALGVVQVPRILGKLVEAVELQVMPQARPHMCR